MDCDTEEVCVEFSVSTTTHPGEGLSLIGDIQQLGEWSAYRVLDLTLQETTYDGNPVWARVVSLPANKEISYRFVKTFFNLDDDNSCKYVDANNAESKDEDSHNRATKNEYTQNEASMNEASTNEASTYEDSKNRDKENINVASGQLRQNVIITSWECHQKPRFISTSDTDLTPPMAIFGDIDGVTKIDRGWLTNQSEVRLRLHSNPVRMWGGRYGKQMYSIKCTTIDLRHGEMLSPNHVGPDEESNQDLPIVEDAPPIVVSALRDSLMAPHIQPVFGTVYKEDDYMTFLSQTFDPSTQGYQFDVFLVHPIVQSEYDMPKHIGSAYLLPMNLDQLTGVKTIPINGLKQKPIGCLKVDYLIVRTLPGNLSDMSVTYARDWALKRPVDVGHRGLGATYCHGIDQLPKDHPKRSQTVKENTIASLSEAYGHGADFVEFDVQLSKDEIPVIYHELAVGLLLKTKTGKDMERFEVPIKDLRMDQLPQLKVKHLAAKVTESSQDSTMDADTMDERPFPTLRQCFERVNPKTGFNIEVKYCMPIKAGGNEQGISHFMERNRYIDVILTDVLKHAKSRRVIFSCFDPDICTMIRVKQIRYPVLFLCNDVRDEWPAYQDVRTNEVSLSAAYCASEDLLGINVALDNLLGRPDLMSWIKSLGLVSFCWGHDEDTNSRLSVARAKQLGVDGVVYDKIHEQNSRRRSLENDFEIDPSTFGMLARSIIETHDVTPTGTSEENEVENMKNDERRPRMPNNDETTQTSRTELSFAGKIQPVADAAAAAAAAAERDS